MNNYDQLINHLYELLKNDKTVVQPWRNKAVARLQEAQAFVRMGQTATRPSTSNRVDALAGVCTCQPGTIDKNCPVHNAMA